jgi:hypothetical protein
MTGILSGAWPAISHLTNNQGSECNGYVNYPNSCHILAFPDVDN